MFNQYYTPREFHEEVVMSLFSVHALLMYLHSNLHMVKA